MLTLQLTRWAFRLELDQLHGVLRWLWGCVFPGYKKMLMKCVGVAPHIHSCRSGWQFITIPGGLHCSLSIITALTIPPLSSNILCTMWYLHTYYMCTMWWKACLVLLGACWSAAEPLHCHEHTTCNYVGHIETTHFNPSIFRIQHRKTTSRKHLLLIQKLAQQQEWI